MTHIDADYNLVMDDSGYYTIGPLIVGAIITISVVNSANDPAAYLPHLDKVLAAGESFTFTIESESFQVTAAAGDGDITTVFIEYAANSLGVYEQPAIVPAAISSQLDDTGRERIHMAPYIDEVVEIPDGSGGT